MCISKLVVITQEKGRPSYLLMRMHPSPLRTYVKVHTLRRPARRKSRQGGGREREMMVVKWQ